MLTSFFRSMGVVYQKHNAMPFRKRKFTNKITLDSNIAKIKGFRDILNEPNTTIVNVLLTHGMGIHDIDYADGVIKYLVDQLELTNFNQEPIQLFGETNNDKAGQSKLIVRTYKTKDKKKAIRFYITHWSDVTKPAKNWLKTIDKQPLGQRTITSHVLKEYLFADGFGDVLLYQSSGFQELIHMPIGTAIDKMTKDTNDDNAANYIISFSLGSKVIFDFVRNATDAMADLCKKFESHLDGVFMLSNQLGLLALCDFDPSSKKPSFTKQLHKNSICGFNNDKTTIVAFTDPNDLLGCRIPLSEDTQHPHQIANLIKPIAKVKLFFKRWLSKRLVKRMFKNQQGKIAQKIKKEINDYIETHKGLDMVNVGKAHTGAKDDPIVLDVLVRGQEAITENIN